MTKTKTLGKFLVATLSCGLFSCASLERPYQTDIMSVKEDGVDVPAVITLSAPTLYGRENLINDRRLEEEFLKQKLTDTTKPGFRVFNSSIQRNLRDSVSTSILASVKFDPTNIAVNQVRQLQNERMLQLEGSRNEQFSQHYNELLVLEQRSRAAAANKASYEKALKLMNAQLRQLQSGARPSKEESLKKDQISLLQTTIFETEIKNNQNDAEIAALNSQATSLRSVMGIPDTSGALSATGLSAISPTPATLEGNVKKLREYFQSQREADSTKFGVVGPTSYNGNRDTYVNETFSEDGSFLKKETLPQTSIEEFRDLLAYRTELRAAIADATLDDLHDYLGNALYRLNFKMLVAPGTGENKQKYGVVNVTVPPPVIDHDTMETLYKSWIMHIVRKSLEVEEGTQKRRYELLKQAGGKLPKSIDKRAKLLSAYTEVGRDKQLFEFHELDQNAYIKFVGEDLLDTDPELVCRIVSADLQSARYRNLNIEPSSSSQPLSPFNDDNDVAEKKKLESIETFQKVYNNELDILKAGSQGDSDFIRFDVKDNLSSHSSRVIYHRTNVRDICAHEPSRKVLLRKRIGDRKVADVIVSMLNERDEFDSLRSSKLNLVLPYGEKQNFASLADLLKSDNHPDYVKSRCSHYENMEEMLYASLEGVRPRFLEESLINRDPLSVALFDAVETRLKAIDKKCHRIQEHKHSNLKNKKSLNKFITLVSTPIERKGGLVTDAKYRLKGKIRTIGAYPLESGQGIGTTANSARSFDAAVSLSAALPIQGLGANGGVQNVRDADAAIAALERVPRLVGYADQNPLSPINAGIPVSDDAHSHFGWIIGPKARLSTESKEIVLEQVLSSLRTSSEISVPGWWPEIELTAKSYWAGNFGYEPGRPNSLNVPVFGQLPVFKQILNIGNSTARPDESLPVPTRNYKVQLPTTSVDYDGLTQFLIRDIGAKGKVFREPQVKSITPGSVSVCSGPVHFVIKGDNVWRGSEVYIGGQKLEDLKVLPNMEGLSGSIHVKNKLMTSGTGKKGQTKDVLSHIGTNPDRLLNVTVATRDGIVDAGEAGVNLTYPEGATSGLTCSDTNVPVDTTHEVKSAPFAITEYSPKSIYNCGGDVTFVSKVRGSDLSWADEEEVLATLGGVRGEVTFSSLENDNNNDEIEFAIVKAKFPVKNLPKAGQIDYSIAIDDVGLDAKPVAMQVCPATTPQQGTAPAAAGATGQ